MVSSGDSGDSSRARMQHQHRVIRAANKKTTPTHDGSGRDSRRRDEEEEEEV